MKLGATLKSTDPSVADPPGRHRHPAKSIRATERTTSCILPLSLKYMALYYNFIPLYCVLGDIPLAYIPPNSIGSIVLLRFSDGLPSTAPPRRDDNPGFAPRDTHRFLPFPIFSQHFLCGRNLSCAKEQAQPAIFRDQLCRHRQGSLKLLDGAQRH